MIHIRPATPADREVLLTFGCAFSAAVEPYRTLVGVRSRAEVARTLDELVALGDRVAILLAEDAAPLAVAETLQVCGCLVVGERVDFVTHERVAQDLMWWVEPRCRGRWVVPRLLHAAEAWARARHLRTLMMNAPIPSSVGRFYERRGYVALNQTYLKVIGPEDDVLPDLVE